MVLVMARWEVVLCEGPPKTFKGELENNSRKPRDLVKTGIVSARRRVSLLFLRVR
jgi:hypothetical protein